MSYVHRSILVPAAHVELARSLCEQLAGPPGSGMFKTEYVDADGATWFGSFGLVEEQFAAAMSDPAILFGTCQALGISVTAAECKALLDAADVSAEPAQAVIARAGLTVEAAA